METCPMDSEHVYRCVMCDSCVDTEEDTFCGPTCKETWWEKHYDGWRPGDAP